MNRDSDLVFKNEDLQKAYEESKSFLDKHTKNLNDLSSDIKSLEIVLKGNGFKNFEIAIHSKNDCVNSEYLSWNNNRVNYLFLDNHNILIEKPLIECKVDVRLKCQPYLIKLLRKSVEVVE